MAMSPLQNAHTFFPSQPFSRSVLVGRRAAFALVEEEKGALDLHLDLRLTLLNFWHVQLAPTCLLGDRRRFNLRLQDRELVLVDSRAAATRLVHKIVAKVETAFEFGLTLLELPDFLFFVRDLIVFPDFLLSLVSPSAVIV